MSIVSRLFGGGGATEADPERIARTIVECYHQRRAAGEFRVDDRLFLELCHVLPEKSAQDVFERFRTRRSRSDPKAEYVLVTDIGVALHDAEHYAKTFGRMSDRQAEVPDRTPPSAANTYRKAINGCPLTGADEDAVLFDDLLKDE